MKRVVLWSVVAALVVATGGAFWFLRNYERVAIRRRDAPKAEARRDPYLALDRFLTRMGRPPVRTSDADVLRSLPVDAALVLDRHREYHLNPGREAALRAWVEQGGYLLVVPEGFGAPDRLVEALGLTRPSSTRRLDSDDEENDDGSGEDRARAQESDGGPPTNPLQVRPNLPWPGPLRTVDVSVPGARRPLTIRVFGQFNVGDIVPDWSAGDKPPALQVAHFRQGRGAVTVVEGLGDLASNVLIGEHDHAELVWALLQRYRPIGPIIVLARLQSMSLWSWLATHARAALVSALVCLVLWLWHVAPRFGQVTPPASPDRRQLREHLRAAGRFVWRQGGSNAWLTVVRNALDERMARRLPPGLSADERVRALAGQTGLSPEAIARALRAPADNAASFLAISRTLQQLERSL